MHRLYQLDDILSMSNKIIFKNMEFIDKAPFSFFILFALTLGLAPFFPEPHLVEKVRMLLNGHLQKPIDIFDLFFHLTPWVLLVVKVYRKWS